MIRLPILSLLAASIAIAQPAPPPILPEATVATNDSVTLAWDPSPDTIAHYVVYYGITSRTNIPAGQGVPYPNFTNAGDGLTWTVEGLEIGQTYYFAVTAIGTNTLESDFSNEVSYQVPDLPPAPPSNLGLSQVPVYVLEIYFSDVPGSWDTNRVARFVVVTEKPYQFFTVSNHVETVEAIRVP